MNPFWLVFLVIPFLALGAREFSKRRVSLWLILIVYMVVGWGLANLAVHWHFASLDAQVQNSALPSPELLDEWQSDGAAYVFALCFGWLYSAIYFLLCLWVYYIVRYFVKRPQKLDA
jgi:hypothetical protein